MSERWNGVVKSLHWSIVLVMLIEVPAGFVMTSTYGPSFRDRDVLRLHELASQIHHTIGYFVLLGALVWIVWRAKRPRPAWEPGLPPAQRVLAASVHLALIALLVIVPWSGWTALSSLADSPQFGPTHRWFFGLDGVVPRIWTALPFNDPSGYRRFASIHRYALWLGLVLVSLHVPSALWHHWIARDGVLRRMWPLGAATSSGGGGGSVAERR